jgi:hypothetical protein
MPANDSLMQKRRKSSATAAVRSGQLFARLEQMAERACEESEAWFDGELLCQQLPEHERQNPAMSIIIDFDRCIDA